MPMSGHIQRVLRESRSPGAIRRWLQGAARALWGRTATHRPRTNRRNCVLRFSVAYLVAFLLYAMLALIVTYPLALHLTTQLPSNFFGGDELQNYWNFWWTREALASGRNPYWMPLIYAPDGAPLYLHTLNLFNGLISLPFQLVFGLVPAYNAVILLSLIFAASCADFLVTHITRHRLAGFFGGIIYAFGSYHLSRMLGHTNLLASEWLPIYVLCLMRANETGGRVRTGHVAGAAAALLLLALCDWQFVMFALFFTVTYSLYVLFARRSVLPLLIAAAIGGIWCIIAAPILIPTLAEITQGLTETPPLSGVRAGSADVISYFIPGPQQQQWGEWPAVLNDRLRPKGGEIASFIGYLPLALVAIALWLDRRRARFWMLATLVFIVLSLGPYLKIAGTTAFGPAGRPVPLPYLLVEQLPGLNIARVPARLSVVVTLCTAVLAGIGIAALIRRYESRLPRAAQMILIPLLICGLVGEHLALPVPLESLVPRPFYERLGTSNESGAILEWPYCKQCAQTNFDQTIHGHPVVGGYISRRILDYPIRELPPHFKLPTQTNDIIKYPVSLDNVGRWALHYSGVRWIVLNLQDDQYKPDEIPQFLDTFAEPGPIYRDDTMAVYYARQPDSGPSEYLELRDGWSGSEFTPDRQLWTRWFATAGTFMAWNLQRFAE